MPKTTDNRLTIAQIFTVIPREKRNGKHYCPLCKGWYLTVNQKAADFSCKNAPPCSATEIAAHIWSEINKRAGKPPKEDKKPSGDGLTLAEYANSKRLPEDWLREQFYAYDGPHPYYKGLKSAVALPYYKSAPGAWKPVQGGGTRDLYAVNPPRGDLTGTKWRWGWGKNEREFQKGGHAYLYAGRFLGMLEAIAVSRGTLKSLFVVEGESNAQSLWRAGYAAVGVSGTAWKPEYAELECFKRAACILVVQDQKDGKPAPEAAAFVKKVAADFPSGKVRAVLLPRGTKDVSDLWIESEADAFRGHGGASLFERDLKQAVQESTGVDISETDQTTEAPAPPTVEKFLTVTPLSAITPQRIEWLWQYRVPLGFVVLFFGHAGVGKSPVSLEIAARLSAGKDMPDKPRTLPASGTLILAAEDDFATTIRPRLEVSGADLDKIFKVTMTAPPENAPTAAKEERHVAFDSDFAEVENTLAALPDVRLVIVDPFQAYLGKVKQNDDPESRRLIERLQAIAERRRVTFILIGHPNKETGQSGIQRLSGAGAWHQAPRCLWLFGEDPDARDEEKPKRRPDDPGAHVPRPRVMVCGKLTFAPESEKYGLKFDTVSAPLTSKGESLGTFPRLSWNGRSDASLSDVLDGDRQKPGPKPASRAAAKEWLAEFMNEAGRPVLSDAVFAAAKEAGHESATLRNAKKDAGVKADRFPKGRGPWYWYLPPWVNPGELPLTPDNPH